MSAIEIAHQKDVTSNAVRIMNQIRREAVKSAIGGSLTITAEQKLEAMKIAAPGNGKFKAAANFLVHQISAAKLEHSKRESIKTKPVGEESDEVEEEDDDEGSPFEWPDNLQGQILFLLCLPIIAALYFLIPNCKVKQTGTCCRVRAA